MVMICLSYIASRSLIFLEAIPNGAEFAGFVLADVYHVSRLSATLKQIYFHWSRIHGILDGGDGVTLVNRIDADLQELCIFTTSGLVHVDEIFGHVLKIPKVLLHHFCHFIIWSVSFSSLNVCGPL